MNANNFGDRSHCCFNIVVNNSKSIDNERNKETLLEGKKETILFDIFQWTYQTLFSGISTVGTGIKHQFTAFQETACPAPYALSLFRFFKNQLSTPEIDPISTDEEFFGRSFTVYKIRIKFYRNNLTFSNDGTSASRKALIGS